MAERKGFTITVLAGVNGAGKSSIGGAFLRQAGGEYFNPDEVARQARTLSPGLSAEEANAFAWKKGKELLQAAIANRTDYAFESTLGGATITALLLEASRRGATLDLWYAGLESVELHLLRVAARVAKGGHNIPVADVRKRWIGSHLNLIKLLPAATNVRVYDNSREGDPQLGTAPEPRLVLAIDNRHIQFPRTEDLPRTPEWAKPIVVAAFRNLPSD